MGSDKSPVKEILKDDKNVIYISRETEKEFIIVRSLDDTLTFIDRNWKVVEDLTDDMFLMSKSVKLNSNSSKL